MLLKKFLLCLLILCTINIQSQSKFQFLKGSKKQVVKFELFNNLIVFPLEVNGVKLSFILDTGVNKTILFNLNKTDSLTLNNTKKVFIRGLGVGDPVEAILSRNNNFRVNNILGTSQDIYVVVDDTFKLSSKMGVTIHGVIGYDLLKDVIVKINYSSKKLYFYKPEKYKEPKCRSCEKLDLEFYRNKPYINVSIKIDSAGNNIPVKMLIDSGGSDALWLFEGSKEEIKVPEKFFVDILGEGLSGTIYGKRSRVPKLEIGKYVIEEPTVSFLDSVASTNARNFKKRDGSIGGNILKRFKVWIDYPNKKIILKKSSSLKKGFYYNMSGLQIIYNGEELVKVKQKERLNTPQSIEKKGFENKVISLVTSYRYRFKSSYKIDKVVKGSPAEKVGLIEGDVIKRLNGKAAYEYSFNDIANLFRTKPNRKIKITVKRGVFELKYEFRLEQKI
ncbi:retropepsin-like aspartic protease [Tenacibaculum halocynthiae]|uniref:retropepsin-like aspartic protease n=1 Tax=Tenacibaculum halocynthiae TaxID=1254437 RepID=UPI0038B5AEFA